jgi:hypothetical protein
MQKKLKIIFSELREKSETELKFFVGKYFGI